MKKFLSRVSLILYVYTSFLPFLTSVGMIVTWNAATAYLGHHPVYIIDDPKDIQDGMTELALIVTWLMMFSAVILYSTFPFLFAFRLYLSIKNFKRRYWLQHLVILAPLIGLLLLRAFDSSDYASNYDQINKWFWD